VLYIHGFIDYFFNRELGNRFVNYGFHFFSIDLRKCGRALENRQHLHYSRNIFEYYEEIDKAIEIIKTDFKISNIVLLGHSTGGLIASLYAHENSSKIKVLILNSPFFDFNLPEKSISKSLIKYVSGPISKVFPYSNIKKNNIVRYLSSLHKEYGGEWDFNQKWKPLKGFPIYYAWANAVRKAHIKLHKGLNIDTPTLLLHSSSSYNRSKPNLVKYEESDVVLNIKHMKKYIGKIAKNATVVEVDKAIHDIFLSPKNIREIAYKEMFNYLKSIGL